MIGPPGLPKFGRHVFRIGGKLSSPRLSIQPLKWAAGLYLAGVLAHFSHEIAFHLPGGMSHSLFEALSNAPTSLVWPADLIGTLLALT